MSTNNETPPISRIVNTSDFKSKCLELMDEVTKSGEEIIITKHGKPVAKLAPCHATPEPAQATPEPDPHTTESGFGRYRGQFQIYGDIVAPMPAEWFAIPDDSQEELY